MRWGLVLGWVLAIPGLIVIACFVLVASLAAWAGCSVAGIEVRCPQTAPGRLVEAAGAVVAATVVYAYVGVGLVPPIYSALWVALRIARRFGWLWSLGLVVLVAAALSVASR